MTYETTRLCLLLAAAPLVAAACESAPPVEVGADADATPRPDAGGPDAFVPTDVPCIDYVISRLDDAGLEVTTEIARTTSTEVVTLAPHVYSIAVSPDRREIALSTPEGFEIFTTSGDRVRFFQDRFASALPLLRWRGNTIAGVGPSAVAGSVFAVDATTGAQLAQDTSADASSIDVSASGRQLLFNSPNDDPGPHVDVFAWDLDADEVVNLTDSDGRNESDPAWSPDGSMIAYTRFNALYIATADMTSERRIGLHANPFDMRWSPDGERIALMVAAEGEPAEIAIVDVASGEVTRLFEGGTGQWTPRWSSDSTTLLAATGTNPGTTVALMRADQPQLLVPVRHVREVRDIEVIGACDDE